MPRIRSTTVSSMSVKPSSPARRRCTRSMSARTERTERQPVMWFLSEFLGMRFSSSGEGRVRGAGRRPSLVTSLLAGVRGDGVDLDRARRPELPGVPVAVLRQDAVVRRGRSDCGDAGGEAGVAGGDPYAGRERLVVARLELARGHARVAAVGVARCEVRIARRGRTGVVVRVVRLDVRKNGADVGLSGRLVRAVLEREI